MDSREIIRRVQEDGWKLIRTKGDHHHFALPTKTGILTVCHPRKDFPIGTVKSMERQSCLTFR